MPASNICATYYGGLYNQITGQDMILQSVDTTQGITGLLEGQNSSRSSSVVATQVRWWLKSYQMNAGIDGTFWLTRQVCKPLKAINLLTTASYFIVVWFGRQPITFVAEACSTTCKQATVTAICIFYPPDAILLLQHPSWNNHNFITGSGLYDPSWNYDLWLIF
jgi:hypothetical protein